MVEDCDDSGGPEAILGMHERVEESRASIHLDESSVPSHLLPEEKIVLTRQTPTPEPLAGKNKQHEM